MKIKMRNYGAEFNLHCPRCGDVDFSEAIYSYGYPEVYRKCMSCGIDVGTRGSTHIVAIVEEPFVTFTPQTYSEIKRVLEEDIRNGSWKLPGVEESS